MSLKTAPLQAPLQIRQAVTIELDQYLTQENSDIRKFITLTNSLIGTEGY